MQKIPELVEKALQRGGGYYSLPDLVSMVRDGEAQAFQHGNSTVVTQLADYPNHREIVFWVGAGRWDEILQLVPAFYDYAAKEGCTRAVSYAPATLDKKMKALGFKEAFRVYTMELNHGQV